MKTIFILMLAFRITISYSQNKQKEVVTNQTILTLIRAGFGKDILIQKIHTSECNFNLSTDSLVSLKKAGIVDDVINAMISADDNKSIEDNIQNSSKQTEDTIEPGIYYCKGQPCSLTEIEASVYSQAKIGAGILTSLTYGIAKTKMKATLSGANANLQIDERNPAFYFHFEKNNSSNFGGNGLQNFWFSSATSPNEFILVKFTNSNNRKSREVVTGSFSSYAGLSSGIDDKYKVSFKYEKESAGVYKVYTDKPLEKGEYCFMYAGSTGINYGTAPLQKVYDFAIR